MSSWARAIDTIIGCTIGIGVLLVTAPRALAVPIPQELAAALDAAQELLKFAAAGNAVSPGARTAPKPNLQHRAIALPDGVRTRRRGAATRPPFRRGIVAAVALHASQHVLIDCLHSAGHWKKPAAMEPVALRSLYSEASGQASLNAALEGLSNALTLSQIYNIAGRVPGCCLMPD